MHILDRIVIAKRREIELKKSIVPVAQLEASNLLDRPLNSMAARLSQSRSGIIAEHKRRSPSKPVINTALSVEEVVKGYENAGVCGMSVLTDGQFFGGSLDDLNLARASVSSPLLRKEFIIDEYQILEAKAHGADVILLIAAILSPDDIISLSRTARDLKLEVLLEVHNEEELLHNLIPEVSMIGVNNRDLKTFRVSLETSVVLSRKIPDEFIRISESGIGSYQSIKELRSVGYQGFLIGEQFMSTKDPGQAATEFITQLEG